MKILRQPHELVSAVAGGSVSIGNFDGVHLGHARLVEEVVRAARQRNRPAVVFTFEPHPAQILRPEQAPARLTWPERKAELLAKLGIDYLITYPTDKEMLQWDAATFFEQVVRSTLCAACLVEGPNFCFGKGRQGDIQLLQRLCQQAAIELRIVPPVEHDGQLISSSRIRQLLIKGDIHQANQLLTAPYRIRGRVVAGIRRGRKLGFPTANLADIFTLVPAPGVYAGSAVIGTCRWPAAIHIGPNPTFGEPQAKVEVHLIGFEGQLYGHALEVDFLARLRDIQTFPSPEALQAQLAEDVAQVRQLIACIGDRS